VIAGFNAAAQDSAPVCRSTDTAQLCFNRAGGIDDPPISPPAVGAVAGADFGRDFSSGFTNFLKVFGTELDMLNVKQSSTSVSALYALELWRGRSALLQGSLRRPELAKDVQASITASKAALSDYTSQLSDFDDVQLGVNVELIGSQRDLKREVESLLFFLYESEKKAEGWDQAVTALQRDCGIEPKKTLGDCPAVKAKVEELIKTVHRSVVGNIAQGFARRFEQLSQLTLIGSYAIRDPLVGRDEARLDVTFEQLLGGKSFSGGCRKPGGSVGEIDPGICEALKNDLVRAGKATRVDAAAGRLSVGASWAYQWPDTATIAAATLERPRAYSFSLVAKWNRILLRTADSTAQPMLRLDAGLSVDILRKDGEQSTRRAVATGTFSVRLSDSLTLPVGVRYASAPADLGDVDVKWSAHVGVNFRLPDTSSSKQ
jgi:hypothetical protein